VHAERRFHAPLPKLGPDANQGDVVCLLLVSHAREQLDIAIGLLALGRRGPAMDGRCPQEKSQDSLEAT
jgi:hypothetical protein